MMRGIDVSDNQGAINWTQVAKKVDFAVLRSVRRSGKADYQFAANLEGCRKRNISVSVYKYTYATTPEAAPSLFAKVLIPDPGVIPDWEQPGPENAYSKGDKVRHKDKIWESLVDNNVWEPGTIGTEGQWKEVTA